MSGYSWRCRGARTSGNACAGEADIHSKRTRLRVQAAAMLAVGLIVMASEGSKPIAITMFLFAIMCALISLQVRDKP
jgi:hypothetical protein